MTALRKAGLSRRIFAKPPDTSLKPNLYGIADHNFAQSQIQMAIYHSLRVAPHFGQTD